MSTFKTAKTSIRFEAGSYEDKLGRTVNFPALEFPTALVQVSQAKQIIRSQVQGMSGNVKEYIGDDDFSVLVYGIITGSNGVEPVQERINLKKMLDAPVPIEVVCPQLQSLGIHLLVVDSYDIPQEEGGISYQKFSINFSSETPKELRITSV